MTGPFARARIGALRRLPRFVYALLWVLAACGGTRCDGGSKPSTPHTGGEKASLVKPAVPLPVIQPPRPDLRLVLLTDPRGYLEPCGCQQRPLGGLDKLATIVKNARAGDVPTIVLSAGDFSVGTELRPDDAKEARDQELMRERTFVEIWARFEPAAIAPGALDLAQEPKALEEISELAGFPWLVDNATFRDAKKKETLPLVQARVVEGQGHKVGLLGLVAPDPAHPPSDGIALSDALAKVAAEKSSVLRAQGAELVIALVSADRRTARAVAGQGPDLVLMGGLHQEEPLPPAVVGNAALLHAGQQGQYALRLDLGLSRDAGSREWEDASNWSLRVARKDIERQIAERRERIEAWQKDPKVDANELNAQRDRLQALQAERDAPKTPTFKGRWLFAELVELAPEIVGDRDVGAQIDEHDKRVNEHNRVTLANRMPLPAPEGTAHYAGSESCASCHKQAYDWWRTTKHGHAYKTLQDVHKEFNLSCVGCHVVGYNQPGGSTVTHVDKLQNVGCESCHGPGSLHNSQPKQPNLISTAVPANVCASCHTHEHSAHFDYEAFKRLLIVPGHGLPGDRQ